MASVIKITATTTSLPGPCTITGILDYTTSGFSLKEGGVTLVKEVVPATGERDRQLSVTMRVQDAVVEINTPQTGDYVLLLLRV